MCIRSLALKFTVAIVIWAVALAAWAYIEKPGPNDHFWPTSNITITGGDPSHKGEDGIISAYKNSLGGAKLQQCGFHVNSTTAMFQKASDDAAKPVLAAPPWTSGDRVYIQALLDSGTSAGLTYCWID